VRAQALPVCPDGSSAMNGGAVARVVQTAFDMSTATFDEVVEILGDVDDEYIERIIDTGASVEQIGEALSDLEDELRFAEERRTETSPQAAAVRVILEELLDEDDEAVVPAISSYGDRP
jgi:hypothetical protein